MKNKDIALTDTQQTKRDPQCIQAAGQTHAMIAACISRKFLLEALYLIAQHIPAGAKHLKGL